VIVIREREYASLVFVCETSTFREFSKRRNELLRQRRR
jgi:hypothetical protein